MAPFGLYPSNRSLRNKYMVKPMIASLFLLFVAFGVALASLIYGTGGIFPILVALSLLTIALRLLAGAVSRPDSDPFSG